jgi:hypothetical protein
MEASAEDRVWWQRLALWGYVLGLRLYLRWLKLPISAAANRLKPQIPWQPRSWPDLDGYAAWLSAHAEWISDPFGGALDVFPSLGHLEWQLAHRSKVQDDCDGLACFSAANLSQFCARPEDVYVVTVVLNPFSFPEKGLLYAAHVLCIFRCRDEWRVISNQYLDPGRWPTFAEAVVDNSYARGRPILYCEVRDRDLRFLVGGKLGVVQVVLVARG